MNNAPRRAATLLSRTRLQILVSRLSLLTPPTHIAAGQTWRRRRDDLELTVTRVDRFGKHNVELSWIGAQDPSRVGHVSANTMNWNTEYELVAQHDEAS